MKTIQEQISELTPSQAIQELNRIGRLRRQKEEMAPDFFYLKLDEPWSRCSWGINHELMLRAFGEGSE